MTRVTAAGRLVALDALRGLAAAVVLVHHIAMTVPAIANAYESSDDVAFGSAVWWATLSPLKLLLAGPEFVLVFFVLSGFVLVRSPLAARGYDWIAYYPRRVIRLGVPVAASIGLAAAWIVLIPNYGGDSGSAWLARQGDRPDLSLGNLLAEASIIGDHTRPDVNPPLWSLTWEMWFSLLLPVAVLIAALTRRPQLASRPVLRVMLWALALCALCSFGYLADVRPLMYLPTFALGALLAANYEVLRERAARLAAGPWGTAAWIGITALGPLLLIAYWLLRPFTDGPWSDLTLSLRVPGAFLIVAAVALWTPLQHPLTSRPLLWLGSISFSLYLVHFPVVVALGGIFGPDSFGPVNFGRAYWWAGAVATVAVSLLLAHVMTAWVEHPAQKLATHTGAWFGARFSPSSRTTTATAKTATVRRRFSRGQTEPDTAD
ncbi:acyltransferase family protein [Glaciibacter superstes]|uniref:acyltransferase family protein n=1 Tax=Glaciibacter superstes TaxID=501023 RepID=UPI00068571F2|nr:acyltransferase [Glaciibacter superstes]